MVHIYIWSALKYMENIKCRFNQLELEKLYIFNFVFTAESHKIQFSTDQSPLQ